MLKEYFLNKIKEKYPDNFSKYNYSLLPNEFKNRNKVNIECLIHGVFEQKVASHLNGQGCRKCAIEKTTIKITKTLDQFIKDANEVHGNFYTYSRFKYDGGKTKGIITCPNHGDFLQTGFAHLSGQGCPRCVPEKISKSKRTHYREFIEKAKEINLNKFEYGTEDEYISFLIKFPIKCSKHGWFLQTPISHLKGFGCKKCAIEHTSNLQRSTYIDFEYKAKLIHGDKYGYPDKNYFNKKSILTITCPIHGDFKQKAATHLKGHGCPRCKESFGERHVSQSLNKYNIKHIREYKISEQPYRYDFYLPDYNIYIEYHGKQHYRSVDYFGGKKALDKSIKRDKVKIELIKRSTGLLITLKYTFNTLEKIEDELLRLFSIIYPQFLSNKELVKQSIIDSNIYLIQDGISYIRK